MSKRNYTFTILGSLGKTYVYATDDKKEARKIFDDWTRFQCGTLKASVSVRIGCSAYFGFGEVRHVSVIVDNRLNRNRNGICK